MRMEFKKLVADTETGINEVVVCYTKEDFLETFGEFYEHIITTEDTTNAVKSYPEELQDVLTEIFDSTAVASFWTNPMLHFNQGVLTYCLDTFGKEGIERVWLMSDYKA